MIQFNTKEEVDNLNDEQAMRVLDDVRERLIEQLVHQRKHAHLLDDCGDYLVAATDNWGRLYGAYFNNDGDSTFFIAEVKKFLLTEPNDHNNDPAEFNYPYGGTDGEVRYDIVPFMNEE